MDRKVSLLVSMLSVSVVSFLLSGCGPAPISAVSTINVGLICSCTGPYASSLVGDEATYKAWASATNAAGGINGHKVNVFFSDDLSNPATSRSEVETMITADHVVAITDDSGVDTAWEAYANQHSVPVVGGGLGGQYTIPTPIGSLRVRLPMRWKLQSSWRQRRREPRAQPSSIAPKRQAAPKPYPT